jgi:hypothetical protein
VRGPSSPFFILHFAFDYQEDEVLFGFGIVVANFAQMLGTTMARQGAIKLDR